MLPGMRHFILILCFAFLVLPAFAAGKGKPAGTTVTDLRMMRDPAGTTRLVLDVTAAVPFRSFVLNNPQRLIIDLPRMNWAAPMNKGDRNRFVKSYRMGSYQKDTLRIVFELNRPVIVSQQMRLAPTDGRPWQYIFDLKPVDPVRFQQAVQKVNVGGEAPATATNNATGNLTGVTTTTAKVMVEPKATQTAPTAIKKPLIIIDAGHGGVDPGAHAVNGMYEKNITLAVAKALRDDLEATGRYRVKMTRDRDIYIKLPERVHIARAAGGDMFISLHADTISRSNVQGASVYTLSEKASDAETAKLAERENAVDSLVNVNVGDVDTDVANILIDLVTRDTMNQSKVLAETVVSTFKHSGIHTLPILPHRSAGFAVLKSPDIPSILIEMGYLSNHQEADNLSDDSYRQKLAGSVAKIVDRYFSETSKLAAY